MEFSILIPVYNTYIQNLAEELIKQAEELTPHYEILFIDDCSELSIAYINQKAKLLPNVAYEILTENIGRAAIRNKLFDTAKYEKCIILDGDVQIIDPDFIKLYLSVLEANNIVVGGHVYQAEIPKDPAKYLHWFYGSRIESRPAKERQSHPYKSFMSANFACTKSTFSRVRFDDELEGYGHEDTLFGITAHRLGIKIVHIENPVQHDGLDNAELFLGKQQKAIRNLKYLYEKDELNLLLRKHSKLIKVARLKVFGAFFSIFRQAIYNNLRGANPNLIFLQMQKLIWWNQH